MKIGFVFQQFNIILLLSALENVELLKKLNKSGKTVVVVTHDINVGNCADRIINIRDGKIVGE